VEDSNAIAVMGEFEDIDLGHEKRNRRLKRVVAALAAKPDASFPEAMGNDAELEGLYRLLNNPNVNAAKLLEPHCAETVERVRSKPQQVVVASHDTTGLEFAGDGRTGLGPMLKSERGFYAHFSLAVNPDERHEPLGILSFIPVIRREKAAGKARGRLASFRAIRKRSICAGRRVSTRSKGNWRGSSVSSMWPIARATRTKSFRDALERSWIRTAAQIRSKPHRRRRGDQALRGPQTGTGVAEREVPLAFRKDHKSQGTLKVFPQEKLDSPPWSLPPGPSA